MRVSGRNTKTTFRQIGEMTYGWDSGDVAYKRLQQTVESGTKRIAEIDRLIERIEVHNNDKYDGHCHVKVDIYFTAVEMIDIPTEKEIQTMVEEIRKNPQDFKFVA